MTHLDLGAIARRFVAFPPRANQMPIAASQRRSENSTVAPASELAAQDERAQQEGRFGPRQWAADEFAFDRAISSYEELIDITVGATLDTARDEIVGTIVEIQLKSATAVRLR
jgi:hypothetical protein